jgi:peptidoglycan biosynthesis protein MviN/MurJ (putative lipid II flippase)
MTPGDAKDPIANPTQSIADAAAHAFDLEEQDFAAALLSVGAVADAVMVCRTQRRVREQSMEAAELRQRLRHAIGLAILGFSLLLLVLTPVVWSSFHLARGWDFADVESQSMYVIGWLFPVTLVGLVLACLRMRAGRGTRRIDHRMDSRLGSMVR